MIGLPILALTAVFALDATRDIDLRERLTMDLGAADAKVIDRAAEPIRQNVTGNDGSLYVTAAAEAVPGGDPGRDRTRPDRPDE